MTCHIYKPLSYQGTRLFGFIFPGVRLISTFHRDQIQPGEARSQIVYRPCGRKQQELCSFLRLLGLSVKDQKWIQAVSMSLWSHKSWLLRRQETWTAVCAWSMCSCTSSCTCLCHEENDRWVLEQVVVDNYSQFVLSLYPCWLKLLKQCDLRIFLNFTSIECVACMNLCTRVYSVCRGQKRASDPLEL